MDKELIVEEKYSGYWIQITIALGLITVAFLFVYSITSDILWKGILRLIAFGGLAATVFSALKVMQGKHTVHLEISDTNLLLTYTRKSQTISKDIFSLDNIDVLYSEKHASFMGEALLFNDQNVRFVPVDSDRPLNLVEVKGRPLALSEEDAQRVKDFVENHAPNADIPMK
ncbi:MAG: hypothetical protein U5K69_22415 [Balneolaceae bacterium]|nr:hypothetical protein [Balneolaceae bacterium]